MPVLKIGLFLFVFLFLGYAFVGPRIIHRLDDRIDQAVMEHSSGIFVPAAAPELKPLDGVDTGRLRDE